MESYIVVGKAGTKYRVNARAGYIVGNKFVKFYDDEKEPIATFNLNDVECFYPDRACKFVTVIKDKSCPQCGYAIYQNDL